MFKSFFENSLTKTTDHVSTLLQDDNVSKISSILMVGGYSESSMLQTEIKNKFSDKDIVIPFGASSTIMRGALVYGHSPISIRERVLKYTYGIEITSKFKEGIDPEHLKTTYAGEERCRKRFSRHVERGQTVKCNEAQIERYKTIQNFQKSIKFPIYASENKNIRYTYECIHIGEVNLQLPDPEEHPGRQVVVSMTFSGTEIVVKAVDEKTGKDARVYVNLLD